MKAWEFAGLQWGNSGFSLALSGLHRCGEEEGEGWVGFVRRSALDWELAGGMGSTRQLAGILGNAEGWQVMAVTRRGRRVSELVRLGSTVRWREEEVECSAVGCGL